MDNKESTLVEEAFRDLVYEQNKFGNMLASTKPSFQFLSQWTEVVRATNNLRAHLKRYDSNFYLPTENDVDG